MSSIFLTKKSSPYLRCIMVNRFFISPSSASVLSTNNAMDLEGVSIRLMYSLCFSDILSDGKEIVYTYIFFWNMRCLLKYQIKL